MTIFGKIVMAFFGIGLASLLYFGTSLYVRQDIGETSSNQQTTSLEQNVATSTEATSTDVVTASSTETGTSTTKKIPFTEFMSKGGSYTCDITQTMATMTSKGTVYMHDALVRVEVSNTLAGQSVNTTMIARDGYIYSWTNLSPEKGYKTKVSKSTSSNNQKVYTWNGDQVGEYDCKVWKADDTLFDLPKTVTFVAQ